MKERWKIERTSCGCGGDWAWLRERPSGAWEMQGCVCHHPFTLMLRAGAAHEHRYPMPHGKFRPCRCGDTIEAALTRLRSRTVNA